VTQECAKAEQKFRLQALNLNWSLSVAKLQRVVTLFQKDELIPIHKFYTKSTRYEESVP